MFFVKFHEDITCLFVSYTQKEKPGEFSVSIMSVSDITCLFRRELFGRVSLMSLKSVMLEFRDVL
jgi:hypothetical protein